MINPRWAAFSENDYLRASASAYGDDPQAPVPLTYEARAGEFDLRGFEIAQLDYFDTRGTPSVTLEEGSVKFSIDCVRKMQSDDLYVELLIHPTERRIAVRPTTKENRNGILWARMEGGQKVSRCIAGTAFISTVFSLFGWNTEHRYRMNGTLFRNGSEDTFIFSANNAGVYIKTQTADLVTGEGGTSAPVYKAGKHVGAVPAGLSSSFGRDFYTERSMTDLARQTREQWKIRIEGQLFNSGRRLNITPYEELRAFIAEELGDLFLEDEVT